MGVLDATCVFFLKEILCVGTIVCSLCNVAYVVFVEMRNLMNEWVLYKWFLMRNVPQLGRTYYETTRKPYCVEWSVELRFSS